MNRKSKIFVAAFAALMCVPNLLSVQARSGALAQVYDFNSYESRQQLIARLSLTAMHLREARRLYTPVQIYVAKLSRLCATRMGDERCTPELTQYGLIVQAGDARARRRRLNETEHALLDRELLQAFDALGARGLVLLTPQQAIDLVTADERHEHAQANRDRRSARAYRERAIAARRRDELLLAKRDAMQRRRLFGGRSS